MAPATERLGRGPRRPRAPPRRRRVRWAATSGCAKHRDAGKLDVRARIDYLLDPGSFQELGTLVGGEEAPADAVVMGSGRIDGRPVMVAAEDFTVKAGTISAAGEREALPRRGDRGRRPRAVDHDARGCGVPRRRARSRRPHADRHARPGALLGPGAARHRGPRRVGRPRRARRADLGLHGDEPPRVDLHGRPAGRARVARRGDHQGGARRTGGRAGERLDPQRRRRRRRRARPGAHATSATSRRRRGRTRPRSPAATTAPRLVARDPRHRAAQRPTHLRHAQGDRRRLRRGLLLRGAARVRQSDHLRALPGSAGIPSRSSRTSRRCSPARSTPTAPTRRRASSPSPTRSTCRWCSCPTTPACCREPRSEQEGILRKGARMYAAQTQATSPKFEVTLRKAYGFGSMVMGMIPFDGQSAVFAFPGATMGAMGAAAMSRSRGSDDDEAAMLHHARGRGVVPLGADVRLRRAHRPARAPQRAAALARAGAPPSPGGGRARRPHRDRSVAPTDHPRPATRGRSS